MFEILNTAVFLYGLTAVCFILHAVYKERQWIRSNNAANLLKIALIGDALVTLCTLMFASNAFQNTLQGNEVSTVNNINPILAIILRIIIFSIPLLIAFDLTKVAEVDRTRRKELLQKIDKTLGQGKVE